MKIPYHISPHLIIFDEAEGRKILYNQVSAKEIYIGKMEFQILNMLNGNCNVKKILKKFPQMTSNDIDQLIKIFLDVGLLEESKIKKVHHINNIILFHLRSADFKNVKLPRLKKH